MSEVLRPSTTDVSDEGIECSPPTLGPGTIDRHTHARPRRGIGNAAFIFGASRGAARPAARSEPSDHHVPVPGRRSRHGGAVAARTAAIALTAIVVAAMASGCHTTSTATTGPTTSDPDQGVSIDSVAPDKVVIRVGESDMSGHAKVTTIQANGTAFTVDWTRTDVKVKRTVPPEIVRSLVNLVSKTIAGKPEHRVCGTDGGAGAFLRTDEGARNVSIDQPRLCQNPPETEYLQMLDTVAAEVERTGTPAERYDGPIPVLE